MSAFKTYKGGRLDLEHYRGMTISSYAIDVYNDDDTDFDLDTYDDIYYKVFEKIHGTEVLSGHLYDGRVGVDSPAGNTLYLNFTDELMTLRPKEYWHECYGTRGNGAVKELIFQGASPVI
jgi:hypothetical protein